MERGEGMNDRRAKPMIAVLGSMNVDLVVRVPRLPHPGETIGGGNLCTYCGGKGANQAVAASRLGAHVHLFGKVGDDLFADRLLEQLRSDGVHVEGVEKKADCASGAALIWVDADGENSIVLSPGANGEVDGAYLDRNLRRMAEAEILLLQLEIPMETMVRLLDLLPRERPTVILDPSPVQDLSRLPLDRIDVLTPNEHEILRIGGSTTIEGAADELLGRGVRHVVCTQGERGAIWFSGDGAVVSFGAPKVVAVDSTAAGDAFNGALAWAMTERSLQEAIAIAVQAGSVATTRHGAQPSLPSAEMLTCLG